MNDTEIENLKPLRVAYSVQLYLGFIDEFFLSFLGNPINIEILGPYFANLNTLELQFSLRKVFFDACFSISSKLELRLLFGHISICSSLTNTIPVSWHPKFWKSSLKLFHNNSLKVFRDLSNGLSQPWFYLICGKMFCSRKKSQRLPLKYFFCSKFCCAK